MDLFTVIAFIVYGYGMYWLGKTAAIKMIGSKHVQDTLAKATIPIGVLEKVENQYYLYEKDSTNFLCQAEKLEDIFQGKESSDDADQGGYRDIRLLSSPLEKLLSQTGLLQIWSHSFINSP
jgi:hypothetical protein